MPDNPAEQKAEEARREAHDAVGCCGNIPGWDQPGIINKIPHASIDRAILLARLAQAERMHVRGCGCDPTTISAITNKPNPLTDWRCAAERDRLRREVEEVGKQ